MTPGLPDPAGIAEARTLGGNLQHNGALRFRDLMYALSRLGTAHIGRWGGRSQPREKPRSTRNQFLIFCEFSVSFSGKRDLYIKGKGDVNPLSSPMWDYSHMGSSHGWCAGALVGPMWPTSGSSPFFLFPFYFFSPNGPIRPFSF